MTGHPDVPVGDRLVSRYGALVCDLDGVVYRGRQAVPGAIGALEAAMTQGVRVVFATNNASRTPVEVLSHLGGLGLVSPETSSPSTMSVVTSAEAAARLVCQQVGSGSHVLAVGGPGVAQALRAAGLRPFTAAESKRIPHAHAVVQGAGRDVSWRDLAEAAYRIEQGALWVVTNGDRTIPTARGLAPGNGALAEAVRAAVSVEAQFAGKPAPAMYELALERVAVRSGQALVVGDRLDTDIAGAVAVGIDSLVVLSGAHGLVDIVHCHRAFRPTYVGIDLLALLAPHEEHVDGSVEPLVDERGTVTLPATRGEAGHLLDRVVRGAWQVLDRGDQLPREAAAWGAVEDELRSSWSAWWERK